MILVYSEYRSRTILVYLDISFANDSHILYEIFYVKVTLNQIQIESKLIAIMFHKRSRMIQSYWIKIKSFATDLSFFNVNVGKYVAKIYLDRSRMDLVYLNKSFANDSHIFSDEIFFEQRNKCRFWIRFGREWFDHIESSHLWPIRLFLMKVLVNNSNSIGSVANDSLILWHIVRERFSHLWWNFLWTSDIKSDSDWNTINRDNVS